MDMWKYVGLQTVESRARHGAKSCQTPLQVMPNTMESHLTSNGARAHIERNEHAHRTKRARAPFGVSQLCAAFGMTLCHVWHDFVPCLA